MLPTSHDGSGNYGPVGYDATRSMIPEYFRRVINYSQMDFEYTFWQMFYLCVDPSRVYRTTAYHKQTKNQWARDDPAFVVVLIGFITVASLSYLVAFQSGGITSLIPVILCHVVVLFLGTGVLFATIFWWLANKYLKVNSITGVDQEVEWLYAFDIHCNSYFPLFVAIYVLQYFMLPILTSPHSFFALFLGNALYCLGFGYYYYVTFLGYSALPFLRQTVFFLYPIGAIGVLFLVALLLRVNVAMWYLDMFYGL
eukprot:GFYU01012724.1.p1 GENE.GFYU01012724.1~~GFYU01012724.1.p1  ORF type:complete len:254 (-),score=35.01 GFYU01012724.1:289-1050(-)